MSEDNYYRQFQAFNPATDIGPNPPSELRELITSHPSLKIYTISSPSFKPLKAIWNLNYVANSPLALIRPNSSTEVSSVVKYCSVNKIPLSVRSGGHDLWGRSLPNDGVILDIRELNSIILAEDKKSVTIGGGVQTGPLTTFLDTHGLVTSTTPFGVVGQVGWSTTGGFGPFVNAFGLGVDQIIGASIITADGKTREADDELLWGIKGAGGAFGVLTEVKLKVYHLPKMLAGLLVFKFDEVEKIISDLQILLDSEAFPTCLSIGVNFGKGFHSEGRPMFGLSFSWASVDLDMGRRWLDKVKALGTVLRDMVTVTSFKQWSERFMAILPPPSRDPSRWVFLSKLTPQAVELLKSYTIKMPSDSRFSLNVTLVSEKTVRSRSHSSFPLNKSVAFIHALAPVMDPKLLESAKDWTSGFFDAMSALSIKSEHRAIMEPSLSVEDCFGTENFARLKALKMAIDPENVFNSVPAQLI